MHRKAPVRLRRRNRSHVSIVISSIGSTLVIPALLTRTSRPDGQNVSRPRSIAAESVMSTRRATTVPDSLLVATALVSACAVAWAAGSSMSQIATSAPRLASRCATARPMPRAPPVTTAERPAKDMARSSGSCSPAKPEGLSLAILVVNELIDAIDLAGGNGNGLSQKQSEVCDAGELLHGHRGVECLAGRFSDRDHAMVGEEHCAILADRLRRTLAEFRPSWWQIWGDANLSAEVPGRFRNEGGDHPVKRRKRSGIRRVSMDHRRDVGSRPVDGAVVHRVDRRFELSRVGRAVEVDLNDVVLGHVLIIDTARGDETS